MAVKGRKCLDLTKVDWISSSFKDSFGSTEDTDDVKSPVEKKLRLGDDEMETDVLCTDINLNRYPCTGNNVKISDVRVWTDKYKPKHVEDLIVHKKKVGEVSDYLKNVFSQKNNNKILLITGPTGCGKTCTLRTVCKNLKINIVEWAVSVDTDLVNGILESPFITSKPVSRSKSAMIQSFNEFIIRATKYSSLLVSDFETDNRKIILFKDLPNVLLENPEVFQEIIKNYYNIHVNSISNISPIVFIMSDQNIVRDLLPDDLKFSLNITNINFNPVTDNNIVKALDRILSLELKYSKGSMKRLNKDELVNIAETSDGDLRSAILKLQFSVSDNNIELDYFKVPKLDRNLKSERTRVIKNSKAAKYKVCEIDKDKTVDFFNSVGRVLYPKKESRQDVPNLDNRIGDYRFVHSPTAICDIFVSEPNKLINILHENYMDRFSNIKDVCKAANFLSTSEVLLSSFWEGKDTTVHYALNVAVRGLMVSNGSPAPNTFRPVSKSKIWPNEQRRKNNLISVRQIFPNVQSESDVLLDVVPYLYKLKSNIQLTQEQNDVICKISKYQI